MLQQGQVFRLSGNTEERSVWAYRYRVGGRGSRRVQRGGFVSERDAGDPCGFLRIVSGPIPDGCFCH